MGGGPFLNRHDRVCSLCAVHLGTVDLGEVYAGAEVLDSVVT